MAVERTEQDTDETHLDVVAHNRLSVTLYSCTGMDVSKCVFPITYVVSLLMFFQVTHSQM